MPNYFQTSARMLVSRVTYDTMHNTIARNVSGSQMAILRRNYRNRPCSVDNEEAFSKGPKMWPSIQMPCFATLGLGRATHLIVPVLCLHHERPQTSFSPRFKTI